MKICLNCGVLGNMQISRGGSRVLQIKEWRMGVETKQMHMLENCWEGAKLNRIHGGNSNTKEGIRTGHGSSSSLTLLHIGIASFI